MIGLKYQVYGGTFLSNFIPTGIEMTVPTLFWRGRVDPARTRRTRRRTRWV